MGGKLVMLDFDPTQVQCTLTDCLRHGTDSCKYWCLIEGDQPKAGEPIRARNRCFNYEPYGNIGWMWPVRSDEVPEGTFVRACGTSEMSADAEGYRQWMEGA